MSRMRFLAVVACAGVLLAACGSAGRSAVPLGAPSTNSPSSATSTTSASIEPAIDPTTAVPTTASTPTTSSTATLTYVDPTTYVTAADARAITSRGGMMLPTLLPRWWSQSRPFAIAPEGDPTIVEFFFEDAKGKTLPGNSGGQEVLLQISRSPYDATRTVLGQPISGSARDYLTPWTEGVCPKPYEGISDEPTLKWHDAKFAYALSALPLPGCFSNFNDLRDLVSVADSLVYCTDKGAGFSCATG